MPGLAPSLAAAVILAATTTAAAPSPQTWNEALADARATDRYATPGDAGKLRPTPPDVDRLAARLREIAADDDLAPARRAWLLHAGILELAALPPTGAARRVVDDLARRPTDALVWHEDEGHRVAIPFYDAAAAARHAMRRFERVDAARRAHAAVAGDAALLAVFDAPADATRVAERAGIVEALATKELAQLAAWRHPVAERLPRTPSLAPLAVAIAKRLDDEALFRAAVVHGQAADMLGALGEIVTALAPDAALRVLDTAAQRDDLASAALLKVGTLAALHPPAAQVLVERLADPAHGGSAALALARLGGGTIAALTAALHDARDPGRQARAALALYLMQETSARRALADYTMSGTAPPGLAAQIERWLAP